jgi:hypothetical protein
MLNGQPKMVGGQPIKCESCHMAKATKSAVGMAAGNGWVGDVSTHIWQINTAPVTRDSMFDGGLVKLDTNGLAAVTLDFVCLPCHQSGDVAWASGWAVDIHTNGLTDVGEFAELPTDFELLQNYPNPFNPTTVISFSLPQKEKVRLEVYDVLGKLVVTLMNEELSPGSHEVVWNGQSENGSIVSSGVYLYKLRAGQFSSVKKMLLLE